MFVDLIYNEVLQRYEASYPSSGTASILGSSLGGSLVGDGTSGAPSIAFTSETTLGFRRLSAGVVQLEGSFFINGNHTVAAVNYYAWTGRLILKSPAEGNFSISNWAETIGVRLKVDALPTVSSGFGTTPTVTAGSTPLAGSINVGTGGSATTGVILWNGTAFPSTPFIVCTCSLGAVPTVAVATTTQVTFTTSVAWPASTILNWVCIGAKA